MERRGFTLVELSIVLVIIGLLIGGILVAQSMIETAKVQSLVRQIQQFDIAVSNFRTKFNGLPGDTTSMGCQNYGSNTCDDGLISSDIGGPPYIIAYNTTFIGWGGGVSHGYFGEIGHFWVDLQKGGFTDLGKTFLPYAGINSALDYTSQTPNTPRINGSTNGGVLVIPCAYNLTLNCYEIEQITVAPNLGTFGTFSPIFTPEFALAVDTKIDDGKPWTGAVQDFFDSAQAALGGGALTYCWSPSGAVGLPAAQYNTSLNKAVCFLQIQMLKDF